MVADFIKSAVGDNCYILPLKDTTEHVLMNGQTIFISTGQRKYHSDNAIQSGEVLYPPTKTKVKGVEVEIQKGDIVYTSHFLTEDENCCLVYEDDGIPVLVHDWKNANVNPQGKQKIYSIGHEFIYGYVREGIMTMLGDHSFLTPIKQSGLKKNGLILEQFSYLRTDVAILTYPSRGLLKQGYLEGDKVLLKEIMKIPRDIRQYKIMVGEKLMYMCVDREILAKIEDE